MKVKVKNKSRLDDFNKYKSHKGLKTSQKRLSIIEYFLKEDRHFSVEELYYEVKKVYPKVSYSTVYRTLKLLADSGLARICSFGDGTTRFEPAHKAEHHDHLVCQRCGTIIEFKSTEIELLQKKIAQKHNFLVVLHKLELYGLCANCKKKARRH
ncbi:Fur family transcriptional regulator [candidate division TA06 bacterium DG_78]|uniref:Ferric uptake regulation protein n=1 Tax=candidate division TA06 bacterium DG_78 TaxID=1703772 RepID=A0A0S7YI75_UNCT6|nr:MAG: Fur family transcriptional regulator [candidate division TA06 bacterium DG_78]